MKLFRIFFDYIILLNKKRNLQRVYNKISKRPIYITFVESEPNTDKHGITFASEYECCKIELNTITDEGRILNYNKSRKII